MNKYSLSLENIGTDVYSIMSRGHHDLEKFNELVRREYPSWFPLLGNATHLYFKRVFNKFVECTKETRGCFPVTYITEGKRTMVRNDLKSIQVPKDIAWIENKLKDDAWFEDGTVFVGALEVTNNETKKTFWEVYTLSVRADENVRLYYAYPDGDEICFDCWEFEDFSHYFVLSGSITSNPN